MRQSIVGTIWVNPLRREEIPQVHEDLNIGEYWIEGVPIPIGGGYAYALRLEAKDVADRSGEILVAWLRQLAERIHSFAPEFALTVTFEVDGGNVSFPFTPIF
ncbi:MAG: hypothetical protein HGA45_10385 [Chloroflexales bacterium]|nr:hypothetical protein [Chloroflexales bacterium]